jgi:hypothetical protein
VALQSAADVVAEAEEQLPPEPGAGDPSGCNVAVRFPDGQRRQRRFPRSAPVSAVRTFCLVGCAEAAAGRPFALAQSFPGAALSPTHHATDFLSAAACA